MKNIIKKLAVLSVAAVACAGMVLMAPHAQGREVSKPVSAPTATSGEFEQIHLPPGAWTFNWGISNKIIKPKR